MNKKTGRIVVASPLQTRGSVTLKTNFSKFCFLFVSYLKYFIKAGVITRGRVIVPPPNNRAFSSVISINFILKKQFLIFFFLSKTPKSFSRCFISHSLKLLDPKEEL